MSSITARQQYFQLPADTHHPGHPGNEAIHGINSDAAAAYWYKRCTELSDEVHRLSTAEHGIMDEDKIVVRIGVNEYRIEQYHGPWQPIARLVKPDGTVHAQTTNTTVLLLDLVDILIREGRRVPILPIPEDDD